MVQRGLNVDVAVCAPGYTFSVCGREAGQAGGEKNCFMARESDQGRISAKLD